MTGLFQRNSVWQVKYYQNGKPRYRSLGTKSRDIAEKKLKHIEADLERGILIERSRTSIAAFLSQYSEHLKAKKRLSPRSLRTDISRLRHFFSFIEKEYPSVRTLEGITSAIISEFLSFKVSKEKVKAKTANHYRQAIHTMFNYAIKHVGFTADDFRFPNPAAVVEKYPEAHPVISYLEPEQIREQLDILERLPQNPAHGGNAHICGPAP